MHSPYKIFPLGDSALTIDFGNRIDETTNQEVITRFRQLKNEPLQGIIDIIPAYSSLTIYYDPVGIMKKLKRGETAFDWMKSQIEASCLQPLSPDDDEEMLVHIPVCYEEVYAPDLLSLATEKKLEPYELIKIHTSVVYKIYMLGFLPGFAYMGEVDERIAASRKKEPVNMVAGSVGIAGRQTGIYPLDSPGGWQIIGRTPWKLFDPSRFEPVLLKAGQKVQFYRITEEEFYEMEKAQEDQRS